MTKTLENGNQKIRKQSENNHENMKIKKTDQEGRKYDKIKNKEKQKIRKEKNKKSCNYDEKQSENLKHQLVCGKIIKQNKKKSWRVPAARGRVLPKLTNN